ncbi:hypothetical protein E2C01_100900 [Portunus trituberculatus]|uniref:Uncharacterized protein n=1 Tax=Portunus trituberculatus TaxID=210409 RepID=A0A5B7KJ34_PORTR|nr:hypothetical protein [Portunus trituberculatus]
MFGVPLLSHTLSYPPSIRYIHVTAVINTLPLQDKASRYLHLSLSARGVHCEGVEDHGRGVKTNITPRWLRGGSAQIHKGRCPIANTSSSYWDEFLLK